MESMFVYMSIYISSRKRHKLSLYCAVYLFYTVRFKKLGNKNDRYDVTNFFWLFLCFCSLKVQQRNHLWCSILYWPVNPLTMLFCQTYSSLRMAWGHSIFPINMYSSVFYASNHSSGMGKTVIKAVDILLKSGFFGGCLKRISGKGLCKLKEKSTHSQEETPRTA